MDYNKIWDDALSRILGAVGTMISAAPFDKTSIGCVIGKNSNGYVVQAFGGQHTIQCSETLSIGQHVAVLAPQSNFKKLIILNTISDI